MYLGIFSIVFRFRISLVYYVCRYRQLQTIILKLGLSYFKIFAPDVNKAKNIKLRVKNNAFFMVYVPMSIYDEVL